jgi:hypothetical protein
MGSRWPHLDAPRHLWLFPIEVLSERLDRVGLQMVAGILDDPGAASWNRFAWIRLMTNLVSSRAWTAASFAVGSTMAAVLRPIELGRRSASYTAIFGKPRT